MESLVVPTDPLALASPSISVFQCGVCPFRSRTDTEVSDRRHVELAPSTRPIEVVSGIREWFRWYKTPDGKALNRFGFGGKALSQGETLSIVDETHEAWLRLRSGAVDAGKLWTGLERGR